MAKWVIERLSKQHERGEFSCGKAPLDTFLRTLVSQYERRNLGRTFVAVAEGQRRVAGFYTCSTGAFVVDILPEAARSHLPRHPLPTVHLGRLAVHEAFRGQRLGETLLFDFMHRALAVSEEFGVFAADVFAKDEDSRAFYLKYDFIELLDSPLHLYLPIKTVRGMFAG
jgi:ribosomal protein S18 acetylase RimI-like enzyme